MGFSRGPNIARDGLVFVVDPANIRSWDGSSSTINDIASGKSITKGANTTASTYSGIRIFASTAGSSGTGTLDTGYRYGNITNGDKVVDSANSWTIVGWMYKDTVPNNWWHIFTDGSSGDILTIYNSSPYAFRTSMNNTANNGVWSAGSDITDYGTDWGELPNGWNNIVLVYDQPNSRLQLYTNGTGSGWHTGRTIHPDFKLRNFYGWGSAQSSYHADLDHSLTLVYSKVLTPEEIQQNYNATKGRFGL